ncbi:DoxX family protein [Enemella evansiae]|uniref:DoxX family protein n=1 Tax=Enemella evansiae TaxID=2016499 RepID=A0A255G6X3_9ACTN|nr:DoxX family protein [Enemella evansiae]OYO04848.1 hypothetical protein CGZ95_02960 [Enemella evansiae]OYO06500.1 hypothetical protein CGZ97_07750 [Enemella evansiae]OYO11669.1 hypothetical protein CGZ94_14720 [Enemella evansiae]TDO86016.1 putative oxidoreductase [Enemella evansiae]
MEIGLLLLRCFLGLLLIGHGSQKLFGVLSGHGVAGTAPIFEAWGLKPGPLMVRLAAVSELVGGVLLILGLFSPLAAAMAIGTMAVAAFVTSAKGFWAVTGGAELAIAYGVLGVVLAFTGPGAWSADAALGWGYLGPAGNSIVALLLGLVPAIALMAYARTRRATAAAA